MEAGGELVVPYMPSYASNTMFGFLKTKAFLHFLGPRQLLEDDAKIYRFRCHINGHTSCAHF